jgi:hypothetical protein
METAGTPAIWQMAGGPAFMQKKGGCLALTLLICGCATCFNTEEAVIVEVHKFGDQYLTEMKLVRTDELISEWSYRGGAGDTVSVCSKGR